MGSTQVLSTPTSSATNRLTTAGTQYDAEGNLVLWNSGPSYEYDAFNRMRRFRGGVAPGSEEWVFAYTADDERVFSARVGGGDTVWSLRGLDNQLLREWRAENGKHSFRDYVWTGRNLLAKIERTPAAGSPGWSEETRHAAVDHLGSVRLWTDAAGANLPGFIYYPFGKQLNSTVDDEQMRFTGHERDLWNTTSANDDLDYMHARHYNPQLGRFLQIDPLAGSVRAPQTLNRYAYVSGNPLSRIDPRGREEKPVFVDEIDVYGNPIPVDIIEQEIDIRKIRVRRNKGDKEDIPTNLPTPDPTTPDEEPEKPTTNKPRKKKDPTLEVIELVAAATMPNRGCSGSNFQGANLTFSADGGSGEVGASFSFELLPNFGDWSLGAGWGIGSGFSLTGNGTYGGGANGDVTFSTSGGGVLGWHGDVTTGHDSATDLTAGVGVGLGDGASITTEVASGNVFGLQYVACP